MSQSKSAQTFVKIASEFTTAPGFRYREDGDYSGQEFRERFLEPHFTAADDKSIVTIDFDGVAGYATSFLEEAFGGLARKHGADRCIAKLRFVSNEDPLLVEEITSYIDDA